MVAAAFPIVDDPVDIHHPHYPASSPLLYNPSFALPPHSRTWRRKFHDKRFVGCCMAIIVVVLVLLVVAVAVMLPRTPAKAPTQINVTINYTDLPAPQSRILSSSFSLTSSLKPLASKLSDAMKPTSNGPLSTSITR